MLEQVTMIERSLKIGWLTLLLTTLTACSALGPDFEGVDSSQLPNEWSVEETEETQQSIEQWWTQFDDPILNALITQASKQNLNLEAAGLRIIQARMQLGISDSYRYPQSQVASGNLAIARMNDDTYNNAALGFDAGWEMDIWGKYARGIESAEASLYATIASYHDVSVTITSEVARNYINYRTYQERILLSERNIKVQERIVDITQIQYSSGNVTELDVQQAKNQLYNTQAALPALKIGMLQSRNALAVLLGILPEQIIPMLDSESIEQRIAQYDNGYSSESVQRKATSYDTSSIVPMPPKVETNINASLVLRRPDLQLAELQAHAQSARIGVAEAELYPSFSLFGSVGIDSTVAQGDSFDFSDSLTLVAGPSFSWNIFQYGRVKDNIRYQDAAFQETLTNYNNSVLEAVQEVDNALNAYQLYQEQKQLRFDSVMASIRAYNISMVQYENGEINFERLLNSVDRLTRSEDSYAQVKGNIANQVIALYKSLGGGWEANTGKAFINKETIEQMQERTDWGDELEPTPQIPDLSTSKVKTAQPLFGKEENDNIDNQQEDNQ